MFKKDFGRLALTLFSFTLTFGFARTAWCDRVQIFDVHKNLQMNSKDPVYRDYYISAGRDSGLKENMIVPVVRMQLIHDPLYNVSRGELPIKIGLLKIIAVGERMSVGRAYGKPDLSTDPVMDFPGLMIGDTVNISDAYVEQKKGDKSASNNDEDGNEADEGETPGPKAEVKNESPPPQQTTISVPVQSDPQAKVNPQGPQRKVASPAPAKPKAVSAKISPKTQKGENKPVPILGEVPGLLPDQTIR